MSMSTLKKQAAEKAVEQVESGMVVGLGTGSTAVFATRAIGQLLENGRLANITAIPTSEATAREAQKCGIPLITLNTQPRIDLTIDGADEIDPKLNLIKGLGGALLREKIVAAASHRLIIVADDSKKVGTLGTKAPLPVEVIPFAQYPVQMTLESMGANVNLRLDPASHQPFTTDENNIILDCTFINGIETPHRLNQELLAIPGIVDHGLFLNMATQAIVASVSGVAVLTL